MTGVVEVVRWLNVLIAAAVIVAGTLQIRRWAWFSPQERLHWQATAVLNLTSLIGTWESLRGGYAGGFRVYVLFVGLSWLLAAVLYRPVTRWRHRRTHPKETT